MTLELSNVANLPITIYYGDEDRADLLHADDRARRGAVRKLGARLEVPGPARPDAVALLAELQRVTVLVTGGTGFVGSRIVHALRAHGNEVRALVRTPGARRPPHAARASSSCAGTSPTLQASRAALDGCTQVVHLVAILKGTPADFDRVMTQGTRSLVTAAAEAGVERFVLMSALGTTDARTKDLVPYYGAKWAMEQRRSRLRARATRSSGPSFVFGRAARCRRSSTRCATRPS